MRKSALCMVILTPMVFLWTPPASSAPTMEELLQRLDDLSAIVEEQQKEIQLLKKVLEKQKASMEQAGDKQAEQIQKAVKQETDRREATWRERLPEWTRKIRLSGDLRLRYERIWDRRQLENDLDKKDLPSRDRGRIRLRLFADSDITDEVSVHAMIATNQDSHQEATTTNVSFGGDFNDEGIYLHRAYATYKPQWFKGLELGAGKFKNTFYHSDMMWDSDVNPEGVYEFYQYEGSEAFQPFVHLGQMVVNENNYDPDATLYISQAGFVARVGRVHWTLGGSYYRWSNLQNSKWLHKAEYKGTGGNTFVTGPDGSLRYAYEFEIWEAFSKIDFKIASIPFKIMLDYAVNTADHVPGDEDSGYYGSIQAGRDKEKGDFSVYYKYARIEKNAVVGSLNDQDFYGANRKGHKLVLKYVLFRNISLRTALFYTDPVTRWEPSSPTFGSPYNDRYRMHENRFQVDFLFKF